MAGTHADERPDEEARRRVAERLRLDFDELHRRIGRFARQRSGGRIELAEEWTNEAYADALDDPRAVVDLDDDALVLWCFDRVRTHARRERRRRRHAADPAPMAPTDMDGLAGGRLDPQEIVERREETAAYRAAVWAIPDPLSRRILFLHGLGLKPQDIADRIPDRGPREVSTLLYRAKLRVAARAAPIASGETCRRFQAQMPALLEGRLNGRRGEALRAHMDVGDCGCRRIYRRLELDERDQLLHSILPPALILPAGAGAADPALTEDGVHGVLGLARLTYGAGTAGGRQLGSFLESAGAWIARPWSLLAAGVLCLPLARPRIRGARRIAAAGIGVLVVLFAVGAVLERLPDEAPQPETSSPAPATAALRGPPEAAPARPPAVRPAPERSQEQLTRQIGSEFARIGDWRMRRVTAFIEPPAGETSRPAPVGPSPPAPPTAPILVAAPTPPPSPPPPVAAPTPPPSPPRHVAAASPPRSPEPAALDEVFAPGGGQ